MIGYRILTESAREASRQEYEGDSDDEVCVSGLQVLTIYTWLLSYDGHRVVCNEDIYVFQGMGGQRSRDSTSKGSKGRSKTIGTSYLLPTLVVYWLCFVQMVHQ
jgi:hypothetical protein